MAPATLDFWFEFSSTYSYPATMRIGALAAQAGVAVRLRPFLLGPIFQAQGWNTSPFNLYPAKGRNMVRDLERLCGDLGLPFRMPEPFPQNSLLHARVAHVGLGEGWGEDFSRAVYRAEFAEGRPIGETRVVEELLRKLGRDPEKTMAHAASDAVKAKLRGETEEAQRLGVFGAPTFVCSDGELFWGNDRLERALAWANGRRLRWAAQT